MKNKFIKTISTLILSIIMLNYLGSTVLAGPDDLSLKNPTNPEKIEYEGKTYQVMIDDTTKKEVIHDAVNSKYYLVENGAVVRELTVIPSGDFDYDDPGGNSVGGSGVGTNAIPTKAPSGNSGSGKTPNALSAEAAQEQSWIQEASNAFTQNGLGTIVDGIVGLMTIALRACTLLIGFGIQALTTLAGNSAGAIDNGGTVNLITPDQILFNRIAITDINFFQGDRFGTNNQGTLTGSNNPIKAVRESISKWYYALRTISIIILLCILIYVGIRMAISTVAEEKAVYKQWLWNWVVSMALLFVLHFFIIIVININNSFVDMLYAVKNNSTALASGGGIFMDNYIENLIANSVYSSASAIGAWSYTIVYIGIVIFTLIMLIMYIKRMITVAFLILIAPIITITYSVDKLKDNTAQALNEWMKQFIQAVVIQPFHCIIYMVFVATGIACISRFGTLAAGILTIMCMYFLLSAEGIVKKIFGIDRESAGNGMATAVAVGALLSQTKDLTTPKKKSTVSNVSDANNKIATPANGTQQSIVASNNMDNTDPNKVLREPKNTPYNAPDYSKSLGGVSGMYVNKNHGQDYSSELQNMYSNAGTLESAETAYMDRTTGVDISGVMPLNEAYSNSNYSGAINDYYSKEPVIPEESNTVISNENSEAINQVEAMNSNANINEHLKDSTIPDAQLDPHSNEQNNSMSKRVISGAKKVASGAWTFAKRSQIGGFETATGIVSAMVAGIAGNDAGKVIAAGVTGKALAHNATDRISTWKEEGANKFDSYMQKRRDNKIKNEEHNLATSYSRYQKSHNYDSKHMDEITERFKGMKDEAINRIKNPDAQAYARSLNALPIMYAENGQDKDQELAETLRRVKEETFKPKRDNK